MQLLDELALELGDSELEVTDTAGSFRKKVDGVDDRGDAKSIELDRTTRAGILEGPQGDR